jgi:hypothetical protein
MISQDDRIASTVDGAAAVTNGNLNPQRASFAL